MVSVSVAVAVVVVVGVSVVVVVSVAVRVVVVLAVVVAVALVVAVAVDMNESQHIELTAEELAFLRSLPRKGGLRDYVSGPMTDYLYNQGYVYYDGAADLLRRDERGATLLATLDTEIERAVAAERKRVAESLMELVAEHRYGCHKLAEAIEIYAGAIANPKE